MKLHCFLISSTYGIFIISALINIGTSVMNIKNRTYFKDIFWKSLIDVKNIIHTVHLIVIIASGLVVIFCVIGLYIIIPFPWTKRELRCEYNTHTKKSMAKSYSKMSTISATEKSDRQWPEMTHQSADSDAGGIIGRTDLNDNDENILNEMGVGEKETYLRSEIDMSKSNTFDFVQRNSRINRKKQLNEHSSSELLRSNSGDITELEDNCFKSYCNRISTYNLVLKEFNDSEKTDPPTENNSEPYFKQLLRTFTDHKFDASFKPLQVDTTSNIVICITSETLHSRNYQNRQIYELVLISFMFVCQLYANLLNTITSIFFLHKITSNMYDLVDLQTNKTLLKALIRLQTEENCAFHDMETILLHFKYSQNLPNCIDKYKQLFESSKTLSLWLLIISSILFISLMLYLVANFVTHKKSIGVQTFPRRDWLFGTGPSAHIMNVKIQCDIDGEVKMKRISKIWIERQSELMSNNAVEDE